MSDAERAIKFVRSATTRLIEVLRMMDDSERLHEAHTHARMGGSIDDANSAVVYRDFSALHGANTGTAANPISTLEPGPE